MDIQIIKQNTLKILLIIVFLFIVFVPIAVHADTSQVPTNAPKFVQDNGAIYIEASSFPKKYAYVIGCSEDSVQVEAIKTPPLAQGWVCEYSKIGLNAFRNCSRLETVVLGESIESIESNAFENCASLTQVELPKGLTYLGERAFKSCVNLESIIIPQGVTQIGRYTFENCRNLKSVTIPEGVTSIGEGAFLGCTSIEEIKIPQTVTRIDEAAFKGCTKLKKIISLGSVNATSIASRTFENCTKLEVINLPYQITSIGSYAFKGCHEMKRLNIPYSVANIEYGAFDTMQNLEEISVDSRNKNYASVGGVLYENNRLVKYPSNKVDNYFEIPSFVSSISNGAFLPCRNLTKVFIPMTVSDIGDKAFPTSSNIKIRCYSHSAAETYAENYQFNYELIKNISDLYISLSKDHYIYDGNEKQPKLIIKDGDYILSPEQDYTYSYKNNISIGEATINITGLENYYGETEISFGIHEAQQFGYSVEGGTITFNCELGLVTDCDSSVSGANIPEKIEGYIVQGIDNSAFENCVALKSVTLPDTIKTIGNLAFNGCSNLFSITVPQNVQTIEKGTFFNCTSLKQVELPSILTSIGESSFANCINLNKIEIPKSVEIIGTGAFAKCERLSSIKVPESIKTIQDTTFSNCTGLKTVELPRTIQSIGTFAFGNCSSLLEIPILINVKTIGKQAFYKCSSMNGSLQLEAATSIGDSAFSNCKALQGVKLSGKDLVLGEAVFDRCTSLKKATIDSNIRELKQLSFAECGNLYQVEIPQNIQKIGRMAFYKCSNLATIKLPNSLKSIGDAAFAYCGALKKVDLPTSLHKLNNSIFMECAGLEKVIIPENITAIEQMAFSYCSSLKDISIPDNVADMGDYVFAECKNLENATLSNQLRQVEGNVFLNCTKLKYVFIPESVTSVDSKTFDSSKNIVVNCYKGSYAQKFARDHNLAYSLLMDSNHIKIALSPNSFYYDGTQKKPRVTVKDNGDVLRENVDYIVSYQNNVKAGVATITIEGKGVYIGAVSKDYQILEKLEPKPQTISCSSSYIKTYGNKPFNLNIKLNGNGKLSYKTNDQKVINASSSGQISIKGTGVATVAITAQATEYYNSAIKTITVVVNPKKVTINKVTSPPKGQMKVTWKKDTKASGYQILYAKNKQFTKGKKTVTIKSYKTTSKSIKKLSKGKKYYVKMRAYKNADGKKLYGTYSKVKTVKVKR